jgi:hypothetical protein
MDHDPYITLLESMIAAGRVEELPARTPWPMHAALVWLWEESGRSGLRRHFGVELAVTPSPDVGRQVSGADAALRALVRRGVLREIGRGLGAQLAADADAVVVARRRLLTLDPAWVVLLQRAGERWAAWTSSAAKYAPREAESFAPIVLSVSA